jgi:hypothetical protein
VPITGQLPAVAPNPQPHQHATATNQLIKEHNRQDAFKVIYGADTGTATAYAIAPVPGIPFYRVGQIFTFTATNANTSATPTLNVNARGAGTITRINGTALSLGDIPPGPVSVICTATTPTFALLSPYNNVGATTFLGSDLALNNTANFFNGPNTGSIGGAGQTWEISASGNVIDTAGGAQFELAIFNGTTYIAETLSGTSGVFNRHQVTIAPVPVTLTAATTFTLRAKDQTNTTGILATTGGATGASNISTWITAVRLA